MFFVSQLHADAPASEHNVVVEVDVFIFAMVAQLGVGACGAVHDGDTGELNVVQLEVERGGKNKGKRWRGTNGEGTSGGEQVSHW